MPDPTKPTEEAKPTPAQTPPAAAAPPAEPPPADPPPADSPPAATEPTTDPLLNAIFKDLGEPPPVPEVKKVEEAPPTPDKPDADKKPEETKPAEPPPAEKPKKKKATILEVDPEIPSSTKVTEGVPPPADARPQPRKEEDPDAAYVAQLTEEQRAELEEAESAERHLSEKYKGQRKKLLDWNRGFDEKVTALKKENPERTLDENDADFVKLLKTKPAINGIDQRKVIAAVAEERAFERLRKEQAPKIDEVEMRTRAMEIAPTVAKHMDEFKSGTLNFVVEEGEAAKDSLATAAKLLKEGKEVPDELKLEASIVQAHLTAAETLAREYSLLVHKAKPFNRNDPNHVWIIDFIRNQGQIMANAPDEYRVREGRTFVPRDQYFAMADVERAKHWTHSNREILHLLGMSAYGGMKHTLQMETEALEKKGLERRKAKPAANPPTPTPTPTLGAGDPPPTETPGLKAQPTKLKGAATPTPASVQAGATPGGDIDVMVLFPT